jgi:hypothetical protein
MSGPCVLAQRQPPSDIELKAAFCIGYFQADETMVEETRKQFDSQMAGKSREAKQKFRNDLDSHDRETNESLVRLQGYLRPKTGLDEDAVLGAVKRGHLGFYSIDEERNNCHSRCSKAGTSTDPAKAGKVCHAKCMDQWWDGCWRCSRWESEPLPGGRTGHGRWRSAALANGAIQPSNS